jgi:hypothetical protein
MSTRPLALLLLTTAACGGTDVPSVVVHAQPRPTTRRAVTMDATLRNDGMEVPVTFDLLGRSFPLTFSVTPEGHTGPLEVTLQAHADAEDPLSGGSRALGVIDFDPEARVDLELFMEPDDFVVNSQTSGSQFLVYPGFESGAGKQLTVLPDGTFYLAFENDCPNQRCDVLSRRFSPTSLPAANDTSGDAGDFIVNLGNQLTTGPCIDASGQGMVIGYLEEDATTLTYHPRVVRLSIRGDRLDATAIAPSPDLTHEERVVDVAMLGTSGNFVVTWQRQRDDGTWEPRARLYGPDGQPKVNGVTGDAGDFLVPDTSLNNDGVPSVVALDGGGFAIVWLRAYDALVDVDVFARVYDAGATPLSGEIIGSNAVGDQAADVAPGVAATAGGGFVVTWQLVASSGQPMLPVLMRLFDAAGASLSDKLAVVDSTSPGVRVNPQAAVRDDGTIGVVWSDCGSKGDGSDCGLWLQRLDVGGLPVGPKVVANTTLTAVQATPAIAALGEGFLVAWTDYSPGESNIRARVIYDPPATP